MVEEQAAQESPPKDSTDPVELWEHLLPGLKSGAMRHVYEEQQKLVVELNRQRMEKEVEFAVSVVRARAAQELHDRDQMNKIIVEEVNPKREEIRELSKRVEYESKLLDTFSQLGKGII